jgi:hypothetical protein
MKIRSLRGLLLPLILAVVFGAPGAPRVVTAVDRAGQKAVGPRVGAVRYIKGEATAMGVDGRLRKLRVKAPVFVGDRIVCRKDGKVDIELDDGTVVGLGAISEIVIDEYVYRPRNRKASGCVLRFAGGFCRIVTGAITSLNPDRFKVRSRLATIGIRGCETGFRSAGSRDDIYVMGLGETESVLIETTASGNPMIDSTTGRDLPVNRDDRRVINVDKAGFHISVVVGKGPSVSRTTKGDLRQLRENTSHLPPAKYDVMQRPSGSVLILRPDGPANDASQDE